MFSHSPLSCSKSRLLSRPSVFLILIRLLKFFFEKIFFGQELREKKHSILMDATHKKQKKKGGVVISLCCGEMIAYRGGVVTSHLTKRNVTFILDIIGCQIGTVRLCKMVHSNKPIEIDSTTARCEIIEDI